MRIFAYFNPFSNKFNGYKECFNKKLNIPQKFLVVTLTIFATLATLPFLGLGGLATFRALVKRHFIPINLRDSAIRQDGGSGTKAPVSVSTTSAVKVDQVSQDNLSKDKDRTENEIPIESIKVSEPRDLPEDAVDRTENEAPLDTVQLEINDPPLLFSIDAAKTAIPKFGNENKKFVYEKLTDNGIIDDQITVHFCTLNQKWANNQPVFHDHPLPLEEKSGHFPFPQSTEGVEHWTADFADNHLLGFCKGGLLAQEELLCAEHPGLVNLKTELEKQPELEYLQAHGKPEKHRIALIRGAKRRGELKMYGNAFAGATEKTIKTRLTRFDSPQESSIFAMAAPPPYFNPGQTYRKEDIEIFVYRALNAFYQLSTLSHREGKEAHVHTGNWGCGAFGGNRVLAAIAQLAAAESAGVDRLFYYPRRYEDSFDEAKTILNNIRNQFPKITIEQLIDHLAEHTEEYNLRYGVSNGT